MNGRLEKELQSETEVEKKLKKIPHIISEFYYYLSGANKSYTTISKYVDYISEFASYISDGNINENFYKNIKSSDINRYFSSMRNKEINGQIVRLSDGIRAVKWSALNTFFIYLRSENYILENPMDRTKRPQIEDNPDVAYLTEKEVKTLINTVEKKGDYKSINRDLCIIKLGISTGLRISAILQINIEDVDLNNQTIQVIEKGQKVRVIPIGNAVKQQIVDWMSDREKYFKSQDTTALFVSNYKERMTRPGVQYMLDKYTNGVINKHITPHVLRHTCATNLYKKTGDIYLCAEVLNHKNIATTKRYAAMCDEKKKHAVNLLDSMINI